MDRAPYHSDLAEGPPDGAAWWVRGDDGVRVRLCHWPGGDRGTVFLFPGRCEYGEKYGRTATRLAAHGYQSLAIDWRGQGLADRLLKNPEIGHVGRFTDYQTDVRAAVGYAELRELPRPWLLLAHSMGGAIGLRALCERQPFDAAGFSAPMWGILIAPKLRALARTVPILAHTVGLGGTQAPSTNGARFFLEQPFEGNFLTTNPDEWAYMKRQATAVDRFRLGGPSLTWLAESLSETRALFALPKPDLPVHIGVGTLEKIVDPDAIARHNAAWPSAGLAIAEGAEHELLMERPEIRDAFLEEVLAAFSRAAIPA